MHAVRAMAVLATLSPQISNNQLLSACAAKATLVVLDMVAACDALQQHTDEHPIAIALVCMLCHDFIESGNTLGSFSLLSSCPLEQVSHVAHLAARVLGAVQDQCVAAAAHLDLQSQKGLLATVASWYSRTPPPTISGSSILAAPNVRGLQAGLCAALLLAERVCARGVCDVALVRRLTAINSLLGTFCFKEMRHVAVLGLVCFRMLFLVGVKVLSILCTQGSGLQAKLKNKKIETKMKQCENQSKTKRKTKQKKKAVLTFCNRDFFTLLLHLPYSNIRLALFGTARRCFDFKYHSRRRDCDAVSVANLTCVVLFTRKKKKKKRKENQDK
jgi:hypothetical protein